MRGVFIDANKSLADIFERQNKPGDPAVRVNRDPDIAPDQIPALLDGAEIVIIDHTALPTEIARRCHGLKHVVFLGTGARSYMNPEELGELGIEVHLIKGYGDTAVAECAIALMWAAARGIAQMDREMRAGNWLREDGMQLTGKTLGLIGFGGIAAMKPGVLLVNTARGAVVDEAAMIEALKSGHIRHAGLDVFNIEPLPKDHVLTTLSNVTLSAHSAFRTPEASENLIQAAWEHCRRIAK